VDGDVPVEGMLNRVEWQEGSTNNIQFTLAQNFSVFTDFRDGDGRIDRIRMTRPAGHPAARN
jgi:hypothetical protein